MESSNELPKKNVLNFQRWNTHDERRLAIVTWIGSKKTYYRRRRQRALDRLTPVEYEAIYSTAHAV